MKNSFLLFCFTALFSLVKIHSQENLVHISGTIFNTKIQEFTLNPVIPNANFESNNLKIKPDSLGNFELSFPFDHKEYYNFQVGTKNFFLIINKAESLKIYADGSKINEHLNIVGSEDSKNMFDFILLTEKWKIKIDSANRAIKDSPEKSKEINEYMQGQYVQFQSVLSQFISANMSSPALIAALNVLNIERDFQTYQKVITSLNKSFGESMLVQEYVKNFNSYVNSLEDKKPLGIGKEAPLFSEKLSKPINGKEIFELKSLRGNVVLIDFWASWCGPCRRENPNVVKTYNKYKEKGFKVVSVSLDSDEKKWKEAIKKDQLIWPYHVSDLGGWRSKIGQLYGVSSIPFTVLIDEEGRVIKTNLRGNQLEEELTRIYGM